VISTTHLEHRAATVEAKGCAAIKSNGVCESGYLRDAGGLHDWRTFLAVGKARGFVFIGIHAAESFTIGIEHSDQPMMVLAAPVSIESGFIQFRAAFGVGFCHIPILSRISHLVMGTIANN
jgi:hypothetical protein